MCGLGPVNPLAIGLVIGLTASLPVIPLLKSELVRVSPIDPLPLVVVSARADRVSRARVLAPARRAMAVDPVVALRHD